MDLEKSINEQPQKDHANVWAKVKKAISAAMMAGMLASPLAAKDMKKANTYKEPTRIERSAEQVSAEQVSQEQLIRSKPFVSREEAIYMESVQLFDDIISSDLNNVENFEKLSDLEKIKQVTAVKSEIKRHINLLDCLVGDLNRYCKEKNQEIGYLDTLENFIMAGVNDGSAVSFLESDIAYHLASLGVDIDLAFKAVEHEIDHVETTKNIPLNLRGDDLLEFDNKHVKVSDKNGILGNVLAIRKYPKQKALSMVHLRNNIENLSESMTDEFAPELARKSVLWLEASVEGIVYMLVDLEKAGYKFNENDLKPSRAQQQQADLGMER